MLAKDILGFFAKPSSAVMALAAAAASMTTASFAQDNFPDRPIKLVVGYAPSGVTDLSARAFAEYWGPLLGIPVIVENKPGADGIRAVTSTTTVAPNGYELLWASATTQVIMPILNQKLSYDPLRDFQAVAYVSKFDLVLVTSAATGIRSMKGLIDQIRSGKTYVTYVSVGASTPPHLAAAVFASMAGGKAEPIFYKSGPAGHLDLVAGRVTYGFVLPSSVEAQVKLGKLFALAMAAPERSKILPDVPTAKEAGLPEFLSINWANWNGIFAPVKTPSAVVEKLHRTATQVIINPAFIARLDKLGIETMHSATLVETRSFLSDQIARWRPALYKAGIHPVE